ncbi:unnamed protein product [Brassica oleracea]
MKKEIKTQNKCLIYDRFSSRTVFFNAIDSFVLAIFDVIVTTTTSVLSELAMKAGGSGLNPNAAAYVPLYKREADSAKPAAAAATHDVQHQPYGYGVQGKGSFPGSHMRDDDSEMEMEFLLASFSDLSDESIRDVYLANNGDLDATIEMLTQLEVNLFHQYPFHT